MFQLRLPALLLALGISTVARAAGVGGTYQTTLGDMVLKKKGKAITGVMKDGGGPCGFKKGETVLKGQFLDDTVTGTLHICSETAGCAAQDAFVVLLVARKGALLSGAVQARNKACKLPLEGKGIALAKASKGRTTVPKAARVKVARAAKSKTPASGDTPSQVATKEPTPTSMEPAQQAPEPAAAVATAHDVEEKFEDWNPEITGGTGTRADALRLARNAEQLINKGQYEAARTAIMDALKADPGFAEGYSMMGVTYYARDNYDDALDWYKKALTVNPDFGDAYYNIACIYAVEGKKGLALKYLRIALLNGYSELGAMEKDSDLDNLRGEKEYEELLALKRAPAPAADPVLDAGVTPVAQQDAPVDAAVPAVPSLEDAGASTADAAP